MFLSYLKNNLTNSKVVGFNTTTAMNNIMKPMVIFLSNWLYFLSN
ncbi:hypothetical protein [Methanothermococcus sp.]|nr:hypothetical protein [Methanothermococcus sp.]